MFSPCVIFWKLVTVVKIVIVLRLILNYTREHPLPEKLLIVKFVVQRIVCREKTFNTSRLRSVALS